MHPALVLLDGFWAGRRGDQFDESCPVGRPVRAAAG
jgi:hypothetical protein